MTSKAARIRELSAAGMTPAEIARRLNVSHHAVHMQVSVSAAAAPTHIEREKQVMGHLPSNAFAR